MTCNYKSKCKLSRRVLLNELYKQEKTSKIVSWNCLIQFWKMIEMAYVEWVNSPCPHKASSGSVHCFKVWWGCQVPMESHYFLIYSSTKNNVKL